MENEFVPYEEALALKELGFNETCLGFFRTPYKVPLLVNAFQMVDYERNLIIGKIEDGSLVPCPTYHQAFKFFREKSLFITIIPSSIDKNHLPIIYNFQKEDSHSHMELKICDTYEEAELACLKHLIEIENDGK